MTDIVNSIAAIIDAYENSYRYNLTEKQHAFCHDLSKAIRGAVFFEADREITLYLNSQKQHVGGVLISDLRLPVDAVPSAENCVVYMPNSDSGLFVTKAPAGFFNYKRHGGNESEPTQFPSVAVTHISRKKAPRFCGYYTLTDREDQNVLHTPAEDIDNLEVTSFCVNALLTAGFFFSLVNQPRFVVQEAGGSRQARRRVERSHGIPTSSWHTIKWNLNKPRVQAGERTGAGRHMPLHYTRGHWRVGQEHWEHIVLREDGKHYKWIEGYWSGHPAYGIKQAAYAPRLGEVA